jgi:predicted acyl esterase
LSRQHLVEHRTERVEIAAAIRFAGGVRHAVRTVELISDLAYTLATCHRLGLIITSSNFPRFAQNPNNGDPFIGGSPPVFVTNTLYLDGMSAIVLAVGP